MSLRRKIIANRLLYYFFQGLLFTVPIAVTLYVLFSALRALDSIAQIPDFPGAGILIVLTGTTLIGYIGSRYISNPFKLYIEKLIEKTPLVKLIYSSVKDLISAFVGEKKSFNKPVLVTFNEHPVIQKIGFITQDSLTDIGLEQDKIAVYLPYSYGMNGQLIVVSRMYVKPIDANGPEMMKFVISGGVSEI